MTNRRTLVFAVMLLTALVAIELLLQKFRSDEKRSQVVLELVQSDKILSNELYRILYGLEDDFAFFEKNIRDILQGTSAQAKTQTLLEFLNTHPHYFKVRLTDARGLEKFKIVQEVEQHTYQVSQQLYDLSEQAFFQDLQQVELERFFFSSMEANIINGEIEKPLRPTVRVAKKIKLKGQEEALLILNLDGKRILQLFSDYTDGPQILEEKKLVDRTGEYIASFPLLPDEAYTLNKKILDEKLIKVLTKTTAQQGPLRYKGDIFVYTKLPLPKGTHDWYLVSSFSNEKLAAALKRDRLIRLFWELLAFGLLVFWFWSDEKKRHREQVVNVLLKERNEFIQNVSHQLKTPLAIISNYLSDEKKFVDHRPDIQSEVIHLIKVVEDLLLLAQIESLDKIPLVRESVLEILNESLSLVGARARDKRVSLRLNIADNLTESMQLLDKNVLPELLKSAFFNILDNAIDFSPQNEVISLTLKAQGARIVIEFSDLGTGVKEELIPQIFKAYVRDASIGRKGSGLGLSITKKIIQLHGGEIQYVKSNRGATFRVTL